MKRSRQLEIADILLDFVARGTTSMADAPTERDVDAYRDPQRFETEKRLFFESAPLLIGLSSELARPGDFVTCNDTGTPVVVMRQDDGSLAAFVNFCRHRGTRLVTADRGHNGAIFACPYHGWSYNRRGKLVGIPYGEGFAGMDRDARGLIRIAVAEKYGLVFIRRAPGPEIDVDAHLGPLAEEMRDWGIDQYSYAMSRPLPVDINWKLAIDTYTEGYHFSILHKSTIANLTHTNIMHYERLGRHYRLAFPALSIAALASQPREDWRPMDHISFVYYLYPNVSINVSDGGRRTVRIFRILPGERVDSSLTIHTAYTHAPITGAMEQALFGEHFSAMHNVIASEDYAVGLGAQQALRGWVGESFIFGRNEPSLIHLHGQLDEVVARGSDGAAAAGHLRRA